MIGVDRIHELTLAGAITPAEGAELLEVRRELADLRRLAGWVNAAAALTIAGWIAFLLLLVGGCSQRAASREPEARPTPWCVSILFRTGAVARGCFENAPACEIAAEHGRRSGRLAGIRAVGSCRRNE